MGRKTSVPFSLKKKKYNSNLQKANAARKKKKEENISLNLNSNALDDAVQSRTTLSPSGNCSASRTISNNDHLSPINEVNNSATSFLTEMNATNTIERLVCSPLEETTRRLSPEQFYVPSRNIPTISKANGSSPQQTAELEEEQDEIDTLLFKSAVENRSVTTISSQTFSTATASVANENLPRQTAECAILEEDMPLTIESDVENSTAKTVTIEGRRVIDFDFFMKQLIAIEEHSEKFGCRLRSLNLVKEKQKGLMSSFHYKCLMCGSSFELNSCDDNALKLNVNAGAVSGAIVTGIGLSNLNELNASMDLPTMSFPLYSSTHDDVAEIWRLTAEKTMQKAAEEERDAAIERGAINDAGIAMISVEADACWSKRSYRTNYSALSGVAAIVGEHTGKVLHIGVRNRYCIVCARAQKKELPARQHECTKNHHGSATSMEQAILVEGFKCSIQEKNLIYHKMIADGDSSTYKRITESRPYLDVPIEKIECTNHLLRNYNGFNMRLANDTSVPKKERNLLTADRITRLRTAIRSASKYRREENHATEIKIKKLQKDIINSTRHIFGDLTECEDYYCTPERKAEPNLVPLAPTLMLKLRTNALKLARNSRSLLYSLTSNRVEQFNSVVAKVVGGKRVNYSLKDSYKARCYAAVVAFNTGKPQYTLYKTLWSQSPGKSLKRLEQKRHAQNVLRTEKPKRYKRKIPFTKSDGQYGLECQQPDINEKDFDHAKELFLEHLKKQALNRFEIERSTILQAESALWLELRRCILTASIFSKICKRRANLNSAPLVK